MINFYDTSAVKALVDARQDALIGQTYERQVEIGKFQARAGSGQSLRQRVGSALMYAGSQIWAPTAEKRCQVDRVTGMCVPVEATS